MEYFAYVLKSPSYNRFYYGMAENPEKRLEEHNKGYTKSTKPFIPWILFYKEKFNSRVEARKREKWFKSGVGREFIKSLDR